MFSLSGPCELLFLLGFNANWTCVVVSVMLYSCIFLCSSVNRPVCIMCCMFDSLCELFGETIRNIVACGSILLLNVMVVLSVGGGAL